MTYNNEELNSLLNRYKSQVDEIAFYYQYPSNISHLLYLIMPAFIIKYGIRNESTILKCFKEVPIVISDNQSEIYQAFYFSKPKQENEHIETIKGIILNNYQNIELMQLLDNLVHEINHAVNSVNNEITIDKDKIYIRTGISSIIYDSKTYQVLHKDKESIIEEVINTKQTEEIINIISSFSNYEILNSEISSTIYAINSSANNQYKSDAYYLQSMVLKQLIENKTFLKTLEELRFKGHIEEIHNWFDNITGKMNSLKELSNTLDRTLELELELAKKKHFKGRLINKIKDLNQKALEIVTIFNNNCNYR